MRFGFVIACVFLLCGSILVARSGEAAEPAAGERRGDDQGADRRWAEDRLTALVDDARLVVPGYDQTVSEEVRFEYRVVYDRGKSSQREARWLKENRGVSLLRANGDVVQQSRVWSVGVAADEPGDEPVRAYRGSFEWLPAKVNDLRSVPGYSPQPLRFVRVDLAGILKDLRDRRERWTSDRRNLAIEFQLDDGSTAVLRLARERGSDAFPIEYLSVRGVDGVTATLCGFDTFAGTMLPSNTCLASIPTLPPAANEGAVDEFTTDEAKARLKRSVKSAFERSIGERNDEGLRSRTASRRAANRDYFTTEEHRDLAKWIAVLAVGRTPGRAEGRPTSDEGSSASPSGKGASDVEALARLQELLVRRIVEPVRVQRTPAGPYPRARKDTERVPLWLTGHLRRRTVDRLQWLTDLDVPDALISALRLAIIDRESPAEVRRGALDLVGEIGVPLHHSLLDELERELADDADPQIRTLLSSVQARTGAATAADARRLRAAVQDSDVPNNIRLIALEGLLLLDDANGLDAMVETTIRNATDDLTDLGRRSAFAAGCSKEGRAALGRIIAAGPADPDFKRALFLAQTSIRASDPEWLACLEAAEAVALDGQAEWELRVKASEIAWFGGRDRPFHDRFMRQAILSADAVRFDRTGWRYLGLYSDGQRFIPELLALVDSENAETRRWAGFCIRRSAAQEIDDPHERVLVLRFITRLAADDDEEVRSEALTLWQRFRGDSSQSFVDVLLPTFVRAAREEVDPEKFASVSLTIAVGVGRKLPVNLLSTGIWKTWREYSAEEKSALVRIHRDEIQATLDKWAAELSARSP